MTEVPSHVSEVQIQLDLEELSIQTANSIRSYVSALTSETLHTSLEGDEIRFSANRLKVTVGDEHVQIHDLDGAHQPTFPLQYAKSISADGEELWNSSTAAA